MQMTKTMMFTAAAALSLACAQAFAAQPVNQPELSVHQSQQMAPSDTTPRMVSFVRKVYFFEVLDRNHNGFLSRSELPKDLSDLRRNFLQVDFDKNGQISPGEYLLYTRGLAPEYAGVARVHWYLYSRHQHDRQIDSEM